MNEFKSIQITTKSVSTHTLGALTAILAGVNVNKTTAVVDLEPAEYEWTSPPTVDVEALAAQLEQRLNVGVQQVQTQAASSVADIRARVEQELGHRLGG